MERIHRLGRIHCAMTAVAFLALAAGCGGTADAPAGDAPAGGGLSGEMIGNRGTIMGNVGAGGVVVNLFSETGGTCNTQSAAQQSATSGPDGAFSFSQPVTQGNYCIEYDGQTHVCGCTWASESCTCSPPGVPAP